VILRRATGADDATHAAAEPLLAKAKPGWEALVSARAAALGIPPLNKNFSGGVNAALANSAHAACGALGRRLRDAVRWRARGRWR
jgi:hypothetical protein